MIDTIRHVLESIRRKPSAELVESRIQSAQTEERVVLTKKMIERPESLTKTDLAKLLDEGWRQ